MSNRVGNNLSLVFNLGGGKALYVDFLLLLLRCWSRIAECNNQAL